MKIPSNCQLLNKVQVMFLVLKIVVRVVWEEGKEGRDSSVAAGTRQKRLILPHNSSKVKEVRDRLMIHNLAGWQAKY